MQVGDRIIDGQQTATVVCVNWNDGTDVFGENAIVVTHDNKVCHLAQDAKGVIWAPNCNGYVYRRNRFLQEVWLLKEADPTADAMSSGAEEYHAIFQAKELMESEDV